MKPLGRIAYMCTDPGIPVLGHKGGSVHVRSVLAELTRRAEEVHLFAAHLDGTVPEELGEVRFHELPRPATSDAAREAALVQADRVAAERLLSVAGTAGFDLLYQRYALWSCEPLEVAAEAGWPSILEVNAPLIEEQARHRRLDDVAGATERTIRAVQSADLAFAVSPAVARWASNLAGRPVPVVPNGVAPERFSAPAPPKVPGSSELVVGFVGTFRPWHDVDGLVDAVAAVDRTEGVSPLRLLLVGDGPGRERAVARAEALGLAVTATGAVAPEEIPDLIGLMDVALAVYDGTDSYFSPLKVFEYMAAGVAVAASAVGGLEDLFRNGEELLLSRPGDRDALVEHLRSLCTDPSVRRSVGDAGRRAVVERHTWSGTVDRVLGLLGTRKVAA
ncbi:MAG: glycosyltransferase family 4 protein [Acidimicrobiales bacterium]|nr:glycosyltransferase family 4 protein [Acidimicrobiales bacterium]